MIDSAILIITFNRPDTTQKVFEVIKQVKPSKLYFFNDGPRIGNIDDIEARNKIKSIIAQVNWDCKLSVKFSETNMGCGLGVSRAISWAFENEESLIILEDDCLPAIPFFSYCDVLLKKYKEDTRICMISGNNYTEEANETQDSYFFSKYGHIWGWATWKRSWNEFDYNMTDWPEFYKSDMLSAIVYNKKERKFLEKYFDKIYKSDEKGTWDHQWFYCRIKNGLSIVPNTNLVTNIGFVGAHTKTQTKAHLIPVNDNFKIENYPHYVLCNMSYDSYHFKKIISRKTPIFTRIKNKLKTPGLK